MLVDNTIFIRGRGPNVSGGGRTSTTAATISNNNKPKNGCDDHHHHQGSNDKYMGHYIVISGVSTRSQDIQSSLELDGTHSCPTIGTSFPSSSSSSSSNSKRFDQSHLMEQQEQEEEPYCFMVVNPAPGSDTVVFVSPQRLEASWRAYGTDEDIIFIRRHSNRIQ